MQRVHRKRIEAAVELWGEFLRRGVESREEAITLLKDCYAKRGLEPIRGRSKNQMYDKELATVYLVGKYGLGLSPQDYAHIFSSVFKLETRCERALDRILRGEDAKSVILDELGETSEDLIFRIIRLAYVAVLLDFRKEEDLISLLGVLEKTFPEYEAKFRGFKKFYIALRIAEAIASGQLRTRLEKEAFKHALCIRLGATKSAPSDEQVRFLATEILGMKEFEVNSVLKQQNIEINTL